MEDLRDFFDFLNFLVFLFRRESSDESDESDDEDDEEDDDEEDEDDDDTETLRRLRLDEDDSFPRSSCPSRSLILRALSSFSASNFSLIALSSTVSCAAEGALDFFLGGTSCAAEGALDFLGGITERQVDLRLTKSRESRKRQPACKARKQKMRDCGVPVRPKLLDLGPRPVRSKRTTFLVYFVKLSQQEMKTSYPKYGTVTTVLTVPLLTQSTGMVTMVLTVPLLTQSTPRINTIH